jgi:hypothetical protein
MKEADRLAGQPLMIARGNPLLGSYPIAITKRMGPDRRLFRAAGDIDCRAG